MGAARLNETERAVAMAAQFGAELTVRELAAQMNVRPHSVQYALTSLLERRVLRPWVAINHYALGFEQFDIFFSISSSSSAAKDKLLEALAGDSRILWYAELGGDFQYAFSLYAKNIAEAALLLEQLARRGRALLVKKQIAAVVFFSLFKKKYLAPQRSGLSRGSIQFIRPAEMVSLDHVDNRVLAALYDQPLASRVAMGKSLGMPRSTVELRIKRLRERGVLLAFIYHISAAYVGAHSYKILIFVRGIRPELRDKLFKYAELAPNVVNFSCCFGAWDYELGVEVFAPEEIGAITGELYDRFAEAIDHMQIIPVFKRNVSNRFMRTTREAR